MSKWLVGKRGFILFSVIALLVGGGLGWATWSALELERSQRQAEEEMLRYEDLALALWRLDGRLNPILAREEARPYDHFSAVYAPVHAFSNDGTLCPPGTVLQLSPLVYADLPDYILLHFQIDPQPEVTFQEQETRSSNRKSLSWGSPQVLSKELRDFLFPARIKNLPQPSGKREALLKELSNHLDPGDLLARLREMDNVTEQQTIEGGQIDVVATTPVEQKQKPDFQEILQNKQSTQYASRLNVRNRVQQELNSVKPQSMPAQVVYGNIAWNGANWITRRPGDIVTDKRADIHVGAMVPLWIGLADSQERLVVARRVRIGNKEICQGMLLDWPKLKRFMYEEIADLFPQATFVPVRQKPPPAPAQTMTALPIQINPGPRALAIAPSFWSPLRVGLALAWLAAVVALAAVALGGWSLIDLSQRRIRFVSAVTHELRTPLTTLRLYLDMLAGGMVQDNNQRQEYLQTLNEETDRLNRLVSNVLDFARLENQTPRLEKCPIVIAQLLDEIDRTWRPRCERAGKELIVQADDVADIELTTDDKLLEQILGNLIDNACKYSRGADDRRIWLRGERCGSGIRLEVEDRGPGIPAGERDAIFRAFRRGRDADTTGGVGLGLALAQRWATLLGGRLTLVDGIQGPGACFRLELPL
ncbi:MAG: hypothetical protein KatS3mg105_2270 [Gemmatales bacterium]|nr:MAG: hypothetical protein KatS3mg105_2270 [Gemmatales bacterium]